jgi:hypothetical protein
VVVVSTVLDIGVLMVCGWTVWILGYRHDCKETSRLQISSRTLRVGSRFRLSTLFTTLTYLLL